jgi:hypothetical protein
MSESENDSKVIVVKADSSDSVGCVLLFILLVGGVTACLWWPVAEGNSFLWQRKGCSSGYYLVSEG